MGVGNGTFFSTEIEEEGNEHRIPRFVCPDKINDFYFRFWIFKTTIVLSTKDGLKLEKKDTNKLKILFGIGGTI